MKYVLVGLVLLWIAYDVGGGILWGLSEARHKQLAEMPMAELLQTVAEGRKRKQGEELFLHAVLVDAYPGRNDLRDELIQDVKLTRRTRDQLEAKWSRGWRSGAEHKLVGLTCRDTRLRLLLSRGAEVIYRISDHDGDFVTQIPVLNRQCS